MFGNTRICTKHGKWGAVLYHSQFGCGICGLEERYNEIKDKLYNQPLSLRPKIVCLCGSTRFYDEFRKAEYELTMQKVIVLSVGFYPHPARQAHGQEIGCTKDQKIMLDELHDRKIDLADEILVLNVGGYIGDSTRREIEYCKKLGKPVKYLIEVSGE